MEKREFPDYSYFPSIRSRHSWESFSSSSARWAS